MIDATGAPQTILALGGTSEIAMATIDAFIGLRRVERVALAARPSPRRAAAADHLRDAGVEVVEIDLEASDTAGHEAVLDSAAEFLGDIDVTILAVGVLGDQESFEADPDAAVAAAQANYVGPLSLGLRLAPRLRAQGHGSLVILSSVAAERPRRSLFVYGSAKAGLDAFGNGLADALHGTGVVVTVVRPGFVRTRMTEGLDDAPLAVGPEDVAAAIVAAVKSRRGTVYVPTAMRAVMLVLRSLPRPVFRRLPF